MARKTTGSITTRSKKTAVPVEPAAVQVAPELQTAARNDTPKNGKPVNLASGSVPVNLEEEIRRRAYELYLQRRAAAGGENGNPNQDWLIAEREVRSRLGGLSRHATA